MHRHSYRPTFQDILERCKPDAAASAWERAKLASRLRHAAAECGLKQSMSRLSEIKLKAIRTAVAIAPDRIRTTIDDENQIGLLSVRWPGHGQMHLPLQSRLDPD